MLEVGDAILLLNCSRGAGRVDGQGGLAVGDGLLVLLEMGVRCSAVGVINGRPQAARTEAGGKALRWRGDHREQEQHQSERERERE